MLFLIMKFVGELLLKKSQLSGRSHKTIIYSVFEPYLEKIQQARNSGLDLYYKKIYNI